MMDMLRKAFAVCAVLSLIAGPLRAGESPKTLDSAQTAVDEDGAKLEFDGDPAKPSLTVAGDDKPSRKKKVVAQASAGSVFRPKADAPPAPGQDGTGAKPAWMANLGKTFSDPVVGAAAGGLAGAGIGLLLGGPMGAAAGFVLGVFIGALASKYIASRQPAEKKEESPKPEG